MFRSIRTIRTIRSIPRLTEIALILFRHGFHETRSWIRIPFTARLRRLLTHKPAAARISQPTRIRLALQDLGPTFVKLGQILATRPDLFPPAYIEEFQKLQDRVEPVPFDAIRQVVEEELHRPIEEVFRRFDPEPIGAASIAQVHIAETRAGEELVVKVQRPGIRAVVERDMEILGLIAQLIASDEDLAHLDPVGILRAFERTILRELDFHFERANIESMRNLWATRGGIRIPRTFSELSSARILAMERLRGTPLAETSLSPEEGRRVARGVATAMFRQIFDDGIFHADPHGGNIILGEDGSIGLVDFGNVGRLTPFMLDEMGTLLWHLADREYRMAARRIVRMGHPQEDIPIEAFAGELMELLDPYYGLAISEIDVGQLFRAVFATAIRYRIALPAGYVGLGRALVTLEGLVRRLDPGFVMVRECRPFVQRLVARRFRPGNVLREVRVALGDAVEAVREFPSGLTETMRKLREGHVRLRIHAEEMKEIQKRLDLIGYRLPVAVITGALLLASSLFVANGTEPKFLGVSALGLAGLVASGLLGIRIVLSALRH
ncbi:MAG: AarF/ABC1/UbiB kinase family protein [Planctomycetes bacterium]|nr:AarF/ABC1/UbiB kinase family protein [Planctomycetota bacterium]